MSEKMKQVSTYLSEKDKLRLEKQAKKENRSISNLVASIIKQYLEKEGK